MKDGAVHTGRAIRAAPKRYLALLGSMALLGGGAQLAGVSPEPIMIGLSTVTFGWQVARNVPAIRASRGRQRLRALGREVAWPGFLVLATAGAGHLAGPSAPAATPTAAGVARASGQTVVIGVDIPTILQRGSVPRRAR